LVERPQCFDIIGVQFKQLPDEPLGNLGGRQIHPVQSAEQGQQIESGMFQSRAEIGGDGWGYGVRHHPSMTHRFP
jgi:hypothetical protein